jgi:hypothetical protein
MRTLLAALPAQPSFSDSEYEPWVRASVEYLGSDEAMKSIDGDPYWPKWDSPWWHITLLNEMGKVNRVPERVIRKLTDTLKTYYLPFFPLKPEEIPPGVDPVLNTACHCGLGNIYRALATWGVDVDAELPWVRPWFFRYQLPDGGLNCDCDAYLHSERPSSLVGTIAPLEAVLFHTTREFTDEEKRFLDRGAKCLMDREIMRGARGTHNAEEREDEPDWLKPCFPRFYLYDVLRGLHFIVHWALRRDQPLPAGSIEAVVKQLCMRFPDGRIRTERFAYEGIGTRAQDVSGQWQRIPTASYFPLLKQVSALGQVSPYLTRQWAEARAALDHLFEKGQVV